MWSPFSNIWLYGDTTDVLAARRHGHLVCLGSDWSPSGTKNLLGELKVAALWNDEALGGALDARELGAMATANAGDALARCWGVDVGRLRPGALADVLVTTNRLRPGDDPHENLLRVDERGVRLVARRRPARARHSLVAGGGRGQSRRAARRRRRPQGGRDAAARRAAPGGSRAPGRGEHVVGGRPDRDAARRRRPGQGRAGGTARRPSAGRAASRSRWSTSPTCPGRTAPRAAGRSTDDELDNLVIAPMQSLAHDAAWFADVARAKPHAAVLLRLRERF